MLQCKFCQKTIEANRKRIYCNDECSANFHARNVSNQRKLANAAKGAKFCKYENCNKQLPIGDLRKSYCRGTDCALKQNALDTNRKNRAKPKKKATTRPCDYVNCGKDFIVAPQRPRQLYCNQECRRLATIKRKEAPIVKVRGEAKAETNVPSRYLTRGQIKYTGHR